jgi:hypothetical protein
MDMQISDSRARRASSKNKIIVSVVNHAHSAEELTLPSPRLRNPMFSTDTCSSARIATGLWLPTLRELPGSVSIEFQRPTTRIEPMYARTLEVNGVSSRRSDREQLIFLAIAFS